VTARLLQRSVGRTVVLEEGGKVVRKTFTGEEPGALLRLAEAERSRLERFADALAEVPGAGCPRPLEVRAGTVVDLRMERAPGLPLLEVLRRRRLPDALRIRLAEIAGTAVIRYVAAVGEPYHDFQFDNMLFDGATGTVTFLDLGLPDGSHAVPCDVSPLEVTLGNLVGSTMFQSARPKWALAVRQHRQAATLCAAIVENVARAPGVRVSGEHLQACTRAAYGRSAFKEGRAGRLWYSSVGYALARRPSMLGIRFSPPLRPPPAHP
jgi:hypothetical protein